MVLEHDIGTLYGIIFTRTRNQGPPLDIETKRSFVEEETMNMDEKGTSYDSKEHKKIMETIFEYMTNNIMKGLEFLAIQSWKKYIDFKKTKGRCII